MVSQKMVSVIIPTYNSRGLLCQSIDSALAQTYKDLEIIVVDDNEPSSSARKVTEELMMRYSSEPRVRYIKHEHNINGAAARNTGIKYSKGKFVAFLDDDDEFLPEKIEAQVNFLENHSEYKAVYNFSSINNKPLNTKPFEGNCIIPLLKNETRMFTPSLMFYKSVLVDIGGFNESFKRHQDYDILVRFFNHGFKMGCIKKIFTNINSIGGNRVLGKNLEILKEKYLNTFDEILNNLEEEQKGIKKQIIAHNYASVFISHLSCHYYNRAFRLFCLYGLCSPRGFFSHLVFYLKSRYGFSYH